MKYLKLFPLLVLILLTSENFSQKIKVIEINNLDLNSQYAEIGIKYLKNQRVLFASSRKDNSNNKRDKRNNRHMGLRLYTGLIGNNGSVSDVQLFSNAEDNPINESNITFTSDYKTVYFTRNNYIQDDYRKQFKKDTLDDHILKLFKASLNSDGSLSNIVPLPINNASYSVTNPQLSPDNKKLFFISDMKGSIGEFDIYEMDILTDGTFGKPKNLGNKINSKGTEMFPYVTQDNILYFASNGRGGFGELDVFSYSLNDAEAKSVNLGKPINSNRDDFSLIYNVNNQIGYFASNRKGGNGDADLYSFLAEPPLQEEEELTPEIIDVVAVVAQENINTVESIETIKNVNALEVVEGVETIHAIDSTEAVHDIDGADDADETVKENNSLYEATVKDESSGIKDAETIVFNNKEAIPPVLIIKNEADSKTTQESNLNNDINSNQITKVSLAEESTIQEETAIEIDSILENSKNNSNAIIETSTIIHELNIQNTSQREIEESLNLNSSQENELVEFKENPKLAEVTQDTLINTPTDSILKQTAIVTTAVIVEEKIEECVQIVEGTIKNNSNTVLSNAKITLYENGKNIGTFDVASDGKYSFELKCNFHYRVTARLNKFEETYFELRTNRFAGTKTTTNIVLERIPCDILIAGQFRDLNTNAPIPGAKLYLILNNEQVSKTTTKKDGSYTFSAQCDESYQVNTDKFGYEEGLFSISQSSVKNTTIKFDGNLIPLPCLQVLNGRVTDLNSGKPIIKAKVDLFNKNGTLKESAQSNNNGNFHFTINCDESYTLKTSYEFFEPASAEFSATSSSKTVHRLDMPLKSMICNQTIEGIVLNARTKVPMGNVEINLLKDGLKIDTKTVSGSGSFSFDILCESKYSITASVKDFNTNSIEFSSSDVRSDKVDITLRLETKLDYELIRGEMMILIEPIDFDLDKSDIKEDAAIELAKIINAMTKNSNISVDIGVHTDSRAPDEYNLTLSEQRAQSIMSYIISRGIDANRLTGKGYGETQLLNKCANGVKCTETEHLENQRIEFKVNQ